MRVDAACSGMPGVRLRGDKAGHIGAARGMSWLWDGELAECIWSQGSYPPWGISRSLPGHVEEKDDFRFSTIGYPMVHCDTRCRAMPRRATSKITRSINDKSLTPLFAIWQRVFRCVWCCEWSENLRSLRSALSALNSLGF